MTFLVRDYFDKLGKTGSCEPVFVLSEVECAI